MTNQVHGANFQKTLNYKNLNFQKTFNFQKIPVVKANCQKIMTACACVSRGEKFSENYGK